jgi:hypothetical protein
LQIRAKPHFKAVIRKFRTHKFVHTPEPLSICVTPISLIQENARKAELRQALPPATIIFLILALARAREMGLMNATNSPTTPEVARVAGLIDPGSKKEQA